MGQLHFHWSTTDYGIDKHRDRHNEQKIARVKQV